MEQVIEVVNENGFWCLKATGWLQPIIYPSGRRAEAAARRLARAITAEGADARLRINDDEQILFGRPRSEAST